MKAKLTVEKDGAGDVSIYPDEDEDMWHIFNLVAEGDRVKASTVR
jgi:protein pelota